MSKSIRIACVGSENVNLDELHELQGNLKSLSKESFAKLRGEILETGYAFPIRVWFDDSIKKFYIVGGHQTRRVLCALRNEGYEIPPLPVTVVEAKSITEARRRVLQDAAQYGRVEKQGLYEFMHEADLNFPALDNAFDIPNVDMEIFNAEFFSVANQSPNKDSENQETKHVLEIELPDEKEAVVIYDELLSRGFIVRYR